MTLPRNNLKSQSGQILIIFLLILVIGLAIIISIASRAITDLRVSTTSEESNRAYFAAEAGVEEALKKISTEGNAVTNGNIDLGQTEVNYSVGTINLTVDQPFVFPNELAKDDVAQIVFLSNFDNLSSSAYGDSGEQQLTLYWGTSGTPAGNPETPAVEFKIVYYTGTEFKIIDYTFDPYDARPGPNNFCKSVGKVGYPNIGGKTFQFRRTINFRIGEGSPCNDKTPTGKLVLGRIKLLYNNTTAHPVAIAPESGRTLPGQVKEIIATGKTDSGVTRKLKVTRLHPSLPGLFDWVFFSGQSINK